ncbi:helix-turn-helix domain-containing protein [Chryseobacterium chendengshani]|uniref:helix-turn-helix domain-containing protein n=1 Tax=unclassified Chryseobacterium TaxID=2593645 RepID=UPI001C63F3FC|nr:MULTISPECIES: helix-turn-helix domain-containing protein [unclassified Chryseobacterium]MBW7676330.1 helix-turn-helix domain-containing protein [Chryseobacterium sp. LJ756]MBW8523702.1 helix-turn-helix domain-containing protein [Chryseobacterium sp. LJ668]QYK16646.1 helix-turn-helix domain-containing protein [Chryseobacterium sp. LJ668]
MRLYIKYMVSLRCKMMVQEEIKKLGIQHAIVDLGTVDIQQGFNEEQLDVFRLRLAHLGLELLDDKKSILIEKIKTTITEMVHNADEQPKENYSLYLSEKLGYDYTYLSNVFSEVNGYTIQHFIIINKIEKVKELLLYNEINLTQIAYKLNYSSVAHLSYQFKKITGLTPSFYKNLKLKRQRNLEDL